MIYEKMMQGQFVYLKSATSDDAEFTLALRQNPALTKYLPKLDITLEQQKNWINIQREKAGDYFFVVRNNEDKPIGTVSIYNISGNESESGRLALIGNALENTEAALLLFKFAFDVLGLKKVTGYIVDGNKRAERFNRQFSCEIGRSEENENGEIIRRTSITDESFRETEKKLQKLLYRKK